MGTVGRLQWRGCGLGLGRPMQGGLGGGGQARYALQSCRPEAASDLHPQAYWRAGRVAYVRVCVYVCVVMPGRWTVYVCLWMLKTQTNTKLIHGKHRDTDKHARNLV